MSRVDTHLRFAAILGICIAILMLTIAYAVMGESLSVHGSAKMEAASWNIHFADLSASVVGKATYTLPTFSNTILTNFDVLLTAPGDSVTFHFRVVNDGTLSAKLTDIVKSIPKCSGTNSHDEEVVCHQLNYMLLEDDGTELTPGFVLYNNSFKMMKLVIEYPKTATQLPEESVIIHNLDVDLLFAQQ